jgi:hypothetical protein
MAFEIDPHPLCVVLAGRSKPPVVIPPGWRGGFGFGMAEQV